MRTVRHLASIFIISALATPAAQAQFKCWTNSEGVRECGNAVPPEYVGERTETINRRGITIDVKERARTPAEIAEQQRLEAEEQARREAEEERLEEQRRYDRMLLSIFTHESEIDASRDQKLEVLDSTIEINHSSLEKLRAKLESYRGRAAGLERAGKPLPDALRDDIAGAEAAIAEKERYIAGKREEKERLKEQADADRLRFRELKKVSPENR